MYAIETTLLHRETPGGKEESQGRLERTPERNSNWTPGGNADRGQWDLEEGAEGASPPRILDLEAGPAGFSAILVFPGGGGGGTGGAGSGLRGWRWWTGSMTECASAVLPLLPGSWTRGVGWGGYTRIPAYLGDFVPGFICF